MYNNQYIIVSKDTKSKYVQLNSVEFDELLIYTCPNLNVSSARNATTQIVLIGYLIDPLNPNEKNDEIIKNLTKNSPTVDEFLKGIQVFSGRYVLLYKTDSTFIVVGDACNLRQIYYGFPANNIVITSSPKLFLDFFGYELLMSKEKEAFLDLSLFQKKQCAWYGDESIDDRLNKILPNHYLDIHRKQKVRMPFFPLNFSSEEQIMEYACLILRNTFSSLAERYQLIQPLTAGWDSRILLAASRNVKEQIQYYVFDNTSAISADVWVSNNLSEKLNLDFKIIKPNELRDDFLLKYKKEHIMPRVLPKTRNIQYHYDCNNNRNVINVNGNCAEIARCYYGYSSIKINLDMLLTFSGYHNKIPYFTMQLEKWHLNSKQYAQEYGIPLLDLFYWEQRIGNWGAVFPFEQDIAIEEVSPFNNRSLLICLMLVSPKRRKSPHYSFFEKLIRNLWGDVLSEPINPGENYIKKVKNGNSLVSYLISKIRSQSMGL